jgi:hypothetical protein
MGKKSGPAAPPPPDPAATAAAQMAANKEGAVAQANLNRIDQYTPQGAITYTQTGTNADGTPKFRSDQTYSADEQAKYDQNNKIALALNSLAGKNIGRVDEAQSKAFSYDGMTPIQTGVNTSGLPRLQSGPAAPTQSGSLPNAGQVQGSFNTGRGVGYMDTAEAGKGMQSGLDYSKLTALAGGDDFSADARRVTDAVYGQATSRLDPQVQQQENAMRSRLAAAGIAENSDAYRREMDNFSRNRTDAYNQANFSAIQAGGAEQSRLFGMSLGARQQGVNEVNTQGQFTNNAQQQRFNQIAQSLGVNNQTAGQEFGQNAAAAAFGNQAQDQRFTQGLAATEFDNNARANEFQMGQQATATNNSARNQGFNEGAANLSANNSARQQQIQEATYLRNLPLNEIAALLGTGGGVNNPMFQNVAQVGVAAPDYQGAVYANYNAANQQYQAKQQARSQMLGSIMGLAGSLGSAAITSDRRLKEFITPIMRDARGLMWYTFNYIGSAAKQFGVMAQEVLDVVPDAVVTMDNGYMAVDYGKLRYGV